MSKNANNSFETLISKEANDKIVSIFKNVTKEHELEFMFSNYKGEENRMGLKTFLNINKYISYKSRATKTKTNETHSLDIIYQKKREPPKKESKKGTKNVSNKGTKNVSNKGTKNVSKKGTKDVSKKGTKNVSKRESYRITIDGINNVNKYMELLHGRNNHVIFNELVKMHSIKESITIMKKIKDMKNVYDIDDFNVRVRMSKEVKVSKMELDEISTLDESSRNDIIFRTKQRVSFILFSDKNVSIRLDLTKTKMHRNINQLEKRAIPIYELEMELITNKDKPNIKYLDEMYKHITLILKMIQQSKYLITKTQTQAVLTRYANLLGGRSGKITTLAGRKARSLEIQHVVEKLPNKYTVTDKADGERYFLVILEKKVYLIDWNLHVKNTGIIISSSKYNDTILDGEYIYLKQHRRHLFMIFDCLYMGGTDIRGESSFVKRLSVVDTVIDKSFIFGKQKGFKIREYSGDFNMKKIIKFHSKQIDSFMDNINNDIEINKNFPLIRRKYFISAMGGQDNEIFKYSELMWNKYVLDERTNCPYSLDGLIYHPLNQKYTTILKESKFFEYKWKPPSHNSIDFYLLYDRSIDKHKIQPVYDNSIDESVKGKAYKIAYLYVGRSTPSGEKPILFKSDIGKHVVHLYLKDGEARDLDGNIIQDNTVVEFYYNNDPQLYDKQRWTPMRTRYEKTESVLRYKKQYGNYVDTANNIWRSMENPFLISDINKLANDKTYYNHIDTLRKKIGHSIIMSEHKENVYYQIRTNLAIPMRNYHNWIKSNLIYTNFHPTYEHGKQLEVLDIGCGKGGDIRKYYYTKVKLLVGIDIDNNAIISPTDGAISRYNRLRQQKPNVPKMFFINADGGAILDYDMQLKVINNMTESNKRFMKKFFSVDISKRATFDRLNFQFTIHYFLENDIIWNNLIQNINMYLRPGGYAMITCFDGDRIYDVLKDKKNYISHYVNDKGEKKVLFELVPKYGNIKKDDIASTGHAIDLYNSISFQEGVYKTEYLVSKKFLIEEFSKKCNMELTDTDMFDNQFHIHDGFLKNAAKYESTPATRQFLMKVRQYYDHTDSINKACYKMTRLYRYYIFRKRDDAEIASYKPQTINKKSKSKSKSKSKKKTKQRGGEIIKDFSFTEAMDLFNSSKYIRRRTNGLKNHTFLSGIHNILKTEKIIPVDVNIKEFYKNINYKLIEDSKINKKYIKKLCKSLYIGHENSEDGLESGLNGVNILIIEQEEDDDLCVSAYGKHTKLDKKKPTIIFYENNNEYQPIYKVNNKTYCGLHDTRKRFIKKLIDESDGELK